MKGHTLADWFYMSPIPAKLLFLCILSHVKPVSLSALDGMLLAHYTCETNMRLLYFAHFFYLLSFFCITGKSGGRADRMLFSTY